MPRICFLIFILISLFSVFSFSEKVNFRKAQAARAAVEIYESSSFDSNIIANINPGKFYFISNKTYGPFYKIKINNKIIGYVADTEIDIEGLGRIKEQQFIDDPISAQGKKNKKDIEKQIDKKNNEEKADEENEDEDSSNFNRNYHGITLGLVNYHEKTMDQLQVADLYTLGYKYIPFLSDYSAAIAWDVNLAYGAPSYYTDKYAFDSKGITLWGGAQIVNISQIASDKTLHYGVGPFLKYANYSLTAKSNLKSYSLQELNFGISLDGGFIFHFKYVSLDIGLRYFWERESYGGLNLGFLF